MDLKALRYFAAAYEAGSFVAAARALDTVQSNVSAHIRDLEELLGAQLFERRYRGIKPTEKGVLLYAHAKRVIAEVETVEKIVKAG